MAIYNYYEMMSILRKKLPISIEDIYDFTELPLEDEFERYHQFCQENLSEHCSDFNIQPAYFFFANDLTVNGGAILKNSHYVIKVNSGTIINLYSLFSKSIIFKENEVLKKYHSLDVFLDNPIQYLMYQLATQFTYYHELAHLIQKSQYLDHGIYENYKDANAEHDYLRHLLEFDADLHGANWIRFHLSNYWDKFDNQFKTQENFEKLLATGVASIFGYFILLLDSKRDIYYYESTHPHPLIRITYILPTFLDIGETGFNIDQRKILRDAMEISNAIFTENKKEDLKGFYENILFREYYDITQYVKCLIENAEKIPYLVINTVHKKSFPS